MLPLFTKPDTEPLTLTPVEPVMVPLLTTLLFCPFTVRPVELPPLMVPLLTYVLLEPLKTTGPELVVVFDDFFEPDFGPAIAEPKARARTTMQMFGRFNLPIPCCVNGLSFRTPPFNSWPITYRRTPNHKNFRTSNRPCCYNQKPSNAPRPDCRDEHGQLRKAKVLTFCQPGGQLRNWPERCTAPRFRLRHSLPAMRFPRRQPIQGM